MKKFNGIWKVINISMTELQIPWWQKFTLSVQETAKYFGFSDKKVRKIIDEHEDDNFVLWNGTRPRIKRQLFEQFVNEKLTDI